MKNVFGYRYTSDAVEGSCFVVRSVRRELAEEKRELETRMVVAQKKARLPKWLEIVGYVFGVFAFCGFGVLFNAIGDGNVPSWREDKWFYIAWLVSICVSVPIVVTALVLDSKESNRPEIKKLRKLKAQFLEKIDALMDIPSEAETISVLGKPLDCRCAARVGNDFWVPGYICLQKKIFVRDGALCLGDADEVYAVPLTEISCVVKAERTVGITASSDDMADLGMYRQFAKQKNKCPSTFVGAYALQISHENETYEILVQEADLPVL